MFNISYLLVLMSAFCLGIANIFYKKSTDLIGGINTAFFYYMFGFLLVSIVWLIFREDRQINFKALLNPFIIAVFLTTSVVTFMLGITNSRIAVSSTIRSLSFLFTILIAVLFLREKISIKQILGICSAVLAIFLLA